MIWETNKCDFLVQFTLQHNNKKALISMRYVTSLCEIEDNGTLISILGDEEIKVKESVDQVMDLYK